jgi:AcrR family transcriptional regulator
MSTGQRSQPRRSADQTREHILTVAGDLFYRQGIRATGVDTVAAQAGIAPPTLYRLFASKDELVAAYVDRCSTTYQLRLTAASSPSAGIARERILAVFDAFTDEALSDSCRGCPFQLVLAEYPDTSSEAHVRAVAHKAWLRALFHDLVRDLAQDALVNDPNGLGEHLALVAEGIYGSVQALGSTGPARHGRACAEALLDSACAAGR